ncbi:60S ribosomal protein L9-A [Sporothrix brasiliensis 5110]|uniref:60S ribosomal protein L9-A n=1 Tax=Sporothrix brasiliensis 5110 TaxID=1398154 RepID=A0A0C2IS07_9PEZI|nr:60S ribosomal protein L9-A [Sporothrix brasiliensis 5110]KIH89625.1 60S ribosomal protein L9-A [Sporothrix brasiliensis 5110]
MRNRDSTARPTDNDKGNSKAKGIDGKGRLRPTQNHGQQLLDGIGGCVHLQIGLGYKSADGPRIEKGREDVLFGFVVQVAFAAADEAETGVKVHIKSRLVTVEGPRGKLTKNLSHVAVNFSLPKKNVIQIEIHHGNRKNVATLRTVRTLINNLIIGVTKGYKYKMRYVYAHFPINVNVDKNSETGLFEVEIRNFIGEKIVRRVVMQAGVDVEISKAQKDELILTGNSLEAVSQSAADIQQICKVRNKDIRKFLDGLYVSEKGNIEEEA